MCSIAACWPCSAGCPGTRTLSPANANHHSHPQEDFTMTPLLDISGVSIEFKTDNGPFKALDNVNLKIVEGEYVSLIGHSGCGKSTVLNIVAGLLQATTGGVVLDGKEVNEPGPGRAGGVENHSLRPVLSAGRDVELAAEQVL